MCSYKLVNDSKEKCSGCGLCSLKCPKKAIEMKEDEYGFSYAYIDKSKCINCNVCKTTCPYTKVKKNKFTKKSYAAFTKNEEMLSTVSSGGVFSTLAQSIIQLGGTVFGSILENNNGIFEAKHVKCNSIEELERIKGSKYVQSNILYVYKEVIELLKEGKNVLFSGTPCQVAAIKKYSHDPHNLYTVDIICHGVPSNKLFNDYINFTNKDKNILIKDFKFRAKNKGWGLYYFTYYYYDFIKKKHFYKTKPALNSSYYQLFLDCCTFRENCYSCPFANENRVGDITIGDYWGIEKEHSELIKQKIINLSKGVSCIIINSSKGEQLINKHGKELNIYISEYDKIALHNRQLNHPSIMRHERAKILNGYVKNGYSHIDSYYKNNNNIKKTLKFIWYAIPYKVRRIVKK